MAGEDRSKDRLEELMKMNLKSGRIAKPEIPALDAEVPKTPKGKMLHEKGGMVGKKKEPKRDPKTGITTYEDWKVSLPPQEKAEKPRFAFKKGGMVGGCREYGKKSK